MSSESRREQKRRRTPLEVNNTSFVRNVTSRMTEILPTRITSWFNGSGVTAEATDDSTEEESPSSPENPVPAKRLKYEPNDISDPIFSMDTPEDRTPNPTQAGPSGQSLTSRRSLKLPESEGRAPDQRSRNNSIFQPRHSVSSEGTSVAYKRKSLFVNDAAETSNKLCGKSSQQHKQSYIKLLASPFYPSQPKYGGASNYVNQPNINQRRDVLVNKPSSMNDSGVSGVTRRIVDLFEQCSSPVIDAKRIPFYSRRNNDSISSTHSPSTQELFIPTKSSMMRIKQRARVMESTSAARQLIASHSSTTENPESLLSSSNNRQEPKATSRTSGKMKSSVCRYIRGNTQETELIEPVDLPAAVLQIDPAKLPKFDIKSPTATTKEPAKIPKSTILLNDNTESTSIDFKFSKPLSISCEDIEEISSTLQTNIAEPSTDRGIDKKKEENEYTFTDAANKVDKTSSDWKCSQCWVPNKATQNKCVCCQAEKPGQEKATKAKCTLCKLLDSQPLKDKCVNCEKVPSSTQAQVLEPENKIAVNKNESSQWKCNTCWIKNDDGHSSCICCGSVKPKDTSEPLQVAASTQAAPKSADADWKCEDCWVSNKSSVEKCVACGGMKPGSKKREVAPPTQTLSNSSGISFKNLVQAQKDKTWECHICLVKNGMDKSLCACCGVEKENKNKIPGPKFNFNVNTTFKFGIQCKTPEVSVANNSNSEIAIDTKLKGESETNNNVLTETPTFTVPLPAKPIQNVVEPPKPKSEASPKTTFTFGIPSTSTAPVSAAKPPSPAKTLQEDKEKPQEVKTFNIGTPALTSRLNNKTKPLAEMFSFKMPLNNNTQSAAPSKLPSNSLSNDKDASTLPAVKPATLAGKSPPKPLQSTFTFGDTALKPTIFGSTTTMGVSINPFNPSQTTVAPSNFAAMPKTTATITNPFGASHTTVASPNLFTPPRTTATATSSNLFNPPQMTTAGTSASSMTFQPLEARPPPLFQEQNPTTTAAASMFQSSATTAAAPPPVAASAPVFGFGNNVPNTPNPTSAAVQPSFFSFRQSTPKSDAPSTPFSSPFTPAGAPLGNGLSTGATNIFSNQQKETSWGANTQPKNMFGPTTTSTVKPTTFTFGSATPFNAPSAGTQNIFGMANTVFPSTVQSNQTGSIFGASQPAAANQTPQGGLFGSPSVGGSPSFGTLPASMPSFEAPTPTPTPTFNFGSNPTNRVFGFGQQPQQPQQPAWGAAPVAAPTAGGPSLFNMGSGAVGNSPTTGRRVRKAVRRTTAR